MRFAQALLPLIDLVFPPRCPSCGAGISAQTGLCAQCWSELAIPGEPACALCQRPFPESVAAGAICAPCLASPPRHDGIAAATLYNATSRHIVLAFKHGHRIALAGLIARLLAPKLAAIGPEWLVVPVPLHWRRLWQRGYNQSALVATRIANERHARLGVDVLLRRKHTPTLGGMGARARKRAVSGAIAVNPKWTGKLDGVDVLLVDDVLTSGATSDACVSALKRAGARKVVVACFARVLDEALEHA